MSLLNQRLTVIAVKPAPWARYSSEVRRGYLILNNGGKYVFSAGKTQSGKYFGNHLPQPGDVVNVSNLGHQLILPDGEIAWLE